MKLLVLQAFWLVAVLLPIDGLGLLRPKGLRLVDGLLIKLGVSHGTPFGLVKHVGK